MTTELKYSRSMDMTIKFSLKFYSCKSLVIGEQEINTGVPSATNAWLPEKKYKSSPAFLSNRIAALINSYLRF